MSSAAFGLFLSFLIATAVAVGIYFLVQHFVRPNVLPLPETIVIVPENIALPPSAIPEWVRTEVTKQPWLPLTGAAYPDHDIGQPHIDTLKSCAADRKSVV